MERFGFIHEKLDIQKLILFILARLEAPISLDTLTELTFCDDGISYFDFSECVEKLLQTEHIQEENGRFSITEKGRRNGQALESSLPYSVRKQADAQTAALLKIQRRNAMIKTGLSPRDSGGFSVSLALGDGLGDILGMELYAATEAQAIAMTETFTKKAEQIYSQLIETLVNDPGGED